MNDLNNTPQFTAHLEAPKSKEVSPKLDKEITEELAKKPNIMKEEK
jgi:hypothetical protein